MSLPAKRTPGRDLSQKENQWLKVVKDEESCSSVLVQTLKGLVVRPFFYATYESSR